MLHILLSILLNSLTWLLTTHDFHTSLSSVMYNENTRLTEIQMQFETDHLEYVLNKQFDTDVHLGEPNEIKDCDSLLEAYINDHFHLKINNKETQTLQLKQKEVDYALTVLMFEPIKTKRKWKHISLSNSLLYKYFPKQEHLVHFFYKDEKASMLFNSSEVKQVIKF